MLNFSRTMEFFIENCPRFVGRKSLSDVFDPIPVAAREHMNRIETVSCCRLALIVCRLALTRMRCRLV
jgi:hypothetical protein